MSNPKPRIQLINLKQEVMLCKDDDLIWSEEKQCYLINRENLPEEHKVWYDAYLKEKEEMRNAIQIEEPTSVS